MSLKQVAADTLALIDAGGYEAPSGAWVSIAEAQAGAVAGTRLYRPDALAALVAADGPGGAPPMVTVTDETTQVAAHRLAARGVALLNFASARNHGGGFINGAKAQEEDLCRCSGLYPTLLVPDVQPYYAANRATRSLLYTDHAILSPSVPFFRTRGRGELLEAPFNATVITAPAPNGGPLLRDDPSAGPSIRETFRRRWANVLAIAEAHAHRTLVLGAWGCGAFGNDPVVSAATLAETLASGRFDGAFDAIAIAIPDQGKQGHRNHTAFAETFG